MSGLYLKQCRKRAKLEYKSFYTLQAVANRVGVSESYLSRVERDLEIPSRDRLLLLLPQILADKKIGLALFGYLDEEFIESIKQDHEILHYLEIVMNKLKVTPELKSILENLNQMNRASLTDILRLLRDF